MNAKAKQKIQMQVGTLKNLPVLPEASLRILEAINTPNVSIDKLAAVLSLSPGLVARLLGLANSAYFARGKDVGDVRTAIFQVLGLDLVKALSMAIIFNIQFDTRKCQEFDSEFFWMRSLLTAVAAQKLAADAGQLRALAPSTVYASGLLLDIGIMVLAYLMPDELNDIFLASKIEQLAVGEEIVHRLGQSHFQLGYLLLNKWQLPLFYQTVLQQYDDDQFSGPEQSLLTLLRICRRLSACLVSGKTVDTQGFESGCRQIDLPMARLDELVEQLSDSKEAMQKLASIMRN